MAAERLPHLVVHGRAGCHLCEDMWQALLDFQQGEAFTLEWQDVDGAPDLARRFGERVPVLTAEGRELCHYFLDAAGLDAFLAEFR
jgi:hypothetical protein